MFAVFCRHFVVLALALASASSAASPTYTALDNRVPVSKADAVNYPRQYDSGAGSYNDPGNSANRWGDNNGGGDNYPTPSHRPKPRNLKSRLLSSVPPSELAESICPSGLYGCPIAKPGSLSSLPTSLSTWTEQGFECIDTKADLRACGGCASIDSKHDCTTIEGANDISCAVGTCVVDSCLPGYSLDSKNNACVRK
ncbi:Protein priA [Psilocybe cubensis]|uniref:Protein CPL1-like domain-containing protein n=2 Tax=Psilocybe cubensis TaxID=181762 RepID=A0A8H8CP93_PSICU|nr:Protein priA [Psilocybe cubensis]KAH9486315.1 Protein priA [Psilocybe cubensis]